MLHFPVLQDSGVLHHSIEGRACGGGGRAEARLHRRGGLHLDEQCGPCPGEHPQPQPVWYCAGSTWRTAQG